MMRKPKHIQALEDAGKTFAQRETTPSIDEAILVISEILDGNHSAQFHAICLERGWLWRCACGCDNPAGWACEECGQPQSEPSPE